MEFNCAVIMDILDTLGNNLDPENIINILISNKFLFKHLYDIKFWNKFAHNMKNWFLTSLGNKNHTKMQIKVYKLLYKNYGFLFDNIEEYRNVNTNTCITDNNLNKLFGINFRMYISEPEISFSSDNETLEYKYDMNIDEIVHPFKTFIFDFEGVTYIKETNNNKGFRLLDICKSMKEMFEAPLTQTQITQYLEHFSPDNNIEGYNTLQLYPVFSIYGIQYNDEENAWIYMDYCD
ncbi:Hypothetical protein ORPV_174 [Orpheovirus IHUMI-LCC2]|uniref:Uncharacterized protein n=1 Tax=Orpheovirus IHUMI-LCC2 TaxID=2023057 RepID=A0A2I2L3G0_9VIRU|nr:Hypothetical protein ORPV_174 [Orpheovirus IHUMI-LCC2]SNW62078.1 Hypothetical protein ORPV_174 [Orpheovirus IHUMI-LCC2]